MDNSADLNIVASLIPEGERLEFLPRHFGLHMMVFERALYGQLRMLCSDYDGGFWDFYDLSNGGCYLAPSRPNGYRIIVSGNGFEGNLDADSTGIVATLFALSHSSMKFPQVERYAERFYQLRDFACLHPDGNLIMAAID
jgi:Antirestriction protein